MSRINPVRDWLQVDLSTTDYMSSAGFQGLYVGTTGSVAIVKEDGSTGILPAMAAGMWHPVRGKGILRSGTTAGNLSVGFS